MMTKMTDNRIHKTPTVKVETQINQKVIIILKVSLIKRKKLNPTKMILIIMRILTISKYILMKMMTQILIKEEEDPKDPKIKKLSLKKLSKVIKL